MTIVSAVLAFAIAFLLLLRSGSTVRHVLAFVIGAALAALFTAWSFDQMYPLPSAARNQMMAYYFVFGTAAALFAPILGMIAAFLVRRSREAG